MFYLDIVYRLVVFIDWSMPSTEFVAHRRRTSDICCHCFVDNKYERSGQIMYRMSNFMEFSEGSGPLTDPVVYFNGWRILGIILMITLAFSCIAIVMKPVGENVWVPLAKCPPTTLKISPKNVPFPKVVNVYVGKRWTALTFKLPILELMDPKNGLYDEAEDDVTFKAEVVAGMAGVRIEDALLVNGELVNVNKHLLAAHSKIFKTLFFGEKAEETPKVQINEVPYAVAYFERLIYTMYPHNVELDDECVEGVLILANRFLLDSVVNRCVDFLLRKSKKPAIFKFRLAHLCGIIGMKELILAQMAKEDFLIAGKNYLDNLSENNKLGAQAVRELSERHKELFGTK